MSPRARRQRPQGHGAGHRGKLTLAVRDALAGRRYRDIPGAQAFLSGFWELCSDRPAVGGMTVVQLPIPFTAVDAWARRNRIRGDDFTLFQRCIRAMDREWLEDAREAAKRAANEDAEPAVDPETLPALRPGAMTGMFGKR